MSNKNKVELKANWATKKSAEYACKTWHYSKCLPSGKLVIIGFWEDGEFIGVIIFGRGTSPHLGTKYGLGQTECVELVRVAMRKHKTEVSKMVKIAFAFLKKANPKLRLVVSFSAQTEGHYGGIYQAGNWIFAGETASQPEYFYKGKRTTSRTIAQKAVDMRISIKELCKRGIAKELPAQRKFRYIMPLDKRMRKHILCLDRPYPKKKESSPSSKDSVASVVQIEEGGATPTDGL